jgi:hypothetical protein
VVVKDSGLVARVARDREVRLQPAFADGFLAEGQTLEFVREGRKVTAILVTPGRSRNIRFDRVTAR